MDVSTRTFTADGRPALDAIRAGVEAGFVPLRVYNDEAIHALEMERIFARAWQFLAHASEIPNPGDYVVRYIGEDSFIVVRGDDGVIRALFNACRHRGMALCGDEAGSGNEFLCPYHGWVYDRQGALRGVPFQKDIYGADGLDRHQRGLVPVAQLVDWEGLVFASLDADAPAFDEWLGDFGWYLQLMTRRSAAGLEVVGAPQRWTIPADWKLGADNFIGDGYHTMVSHKSAMDGGMMPFDPSFLKRGIQITCGRGGLGIAEVPREGGGGWPPELFAGLEQRLSPEQMRIYGAGGGPVYLPGHGTLFPNFSFLNAAASLEPGGPAVPYLTFRVWRPTGPGRMEVWSWCLVEADAPPEFREASYRAYVLSFGASGAVEQDDTENWARISRVARSQTARRVALDYTMGEATGVRPMDDWFGPGTAWPTDYLEANSRAFYRHWVSMLMEEGS